MALSSVARLWRFNGTNYFKGGRYEDAVKAFSRAISIEDDMAARSDRCAALMKLERWSEAAIDASHCLTLDPK